MTLPRSKGSITFKVTDTKPEKVRDYPFEVASILPQQDHYGFSQQKEEPKKYNLVRTNIDSNNNNKVTTGGNSFVFSAFNCYSNHYNWTVKPDDVWIAISTQFSNYVNGNSEELRGKFVNFEGKKELVVYGGGTLMTADYPTLCHEMTVQIAKNIKDPSVREWVIPEFTTTTDDDKLVGAIVLMAAMKNYFDYKMCLCCNLPSVTLLGEVEDWIQVRERANRLVEFDGKQGYMKKWVEMLFPILDQFVDAAKGNPDLKFWNRVANSEGGGSGPSYISGWITTFCVFTEEGQWVGDHKQVDIWGQIVKSEWPILDTNNIPRGYVSVPVLIDDNGTEYNTELFAGHTHSVKGDDGVTLSPAVGWALYTV